MLIVWHAVPTVRRLITMIHMNTLKRKNKPNLNMGSHAFSCMVTLNLKRNAVFSTDRALSLSGI